MKEPDIRTPAQPWAKDSEEILRNLGVSAQKGLDPEQVRRRHNRFGRNRLKEAKKKSAWRILFSQFESIIVLLLAVAASVSFFLQEWVDGIAITAAVFINAAIGFFSELRAARSMEALQELETATARVLRGGISQSIPSEDIVPGDIVFLQTGDMIPADIRLIEVSSHFQANESVLTGESLPVQKNTGKVDENAPVGDRSSLIHKGTFVTKGSGVGVAVATGMDTEVGNIVSLAGEAGEELTPLEKRLNRLGQKLVYVIAVIAGLILAVGLLTGQPAYLMYKVAVSLAVAAIPEGLPIVATIALARGMWRMARQNALVNRLSAVETLGATSVIFTDKTGTLTENSMTLTRIALDSGLVRIGRKGEFAVDEGPVDPKTAAPLREVLEVGMLCNNAHYDEREGDDYRNAAGDPVEIALLAAGAKAGLSRSRLLENFPKKREEPFDSETKKMATYHLDGNGRYRIAVKGAPEEILGISARIRTAEGERDFDENDRKAWSDHTRKLAGEGLRVLAIACGTADSIDSPPYRDLTFLGLAGLWDPPRREIRQAVESCKDAGIRVIMVTGDNAVTAASIGEVVGIFEGNGARAMTAREMKDLDSLSGEELQNLLNVNIFARVSPKQKLDLIRLHQEHGSIVAMTGDGVNDAPALKKADIGVAMGRRGTQVAREAADIVLMDDAFATIVHAVEMGRIIFGNIRKFVLYLLSGNISEISIVSLALLFGAPLPILPLQILYLNMLGDVFPALALGVGKGSRSVMSQKPRDPEEPVITRADWIANGYYSICITASVLGVFALAFHWLALDEKQAVTLSFLTLAFSRLWHVVNMRDPDAPFFKNDVTQNPFIWGALALCTLLLLLAVYIPSLALVLRLDDPGLRGWGLILAGSLAPVAGGQIYRKILPALRGRQARSG